MTSLPLQKLQDLFSSREDVAAVYLFGSVAEGAETEASDVDLGIVQKCPSKPLDKLSLLTDLVRIGMEDVDLVCLDDADPVVVFEAVRHNCLIYRDQTFDHGSFFSRVIRHYFDLRRVLRHQRAARRQKVEVGG